MALDESVCIGLLEKHPELKSLRAAQPNKAIDSFCFLKDKRGAIEDRLYAYCLRNLLTYSVEGVPIDLRLEMLEGVQREDIMYQHELDTWAEWEPNVTIYRGAKDDKKRQGLSWSLDKTVADAFFEGYLLEATIQKDSIIAFFDDNNESEILACVSRFQVIDADDNFKKDYRTSTKNEIRRMRQEGLLPGN